MTDPFEQLREPVTPVDPDPAFARALRARIERALALPSGVIPMTTTIPPEAATTPRPAAVPYLAVADARAAIDWYTEVLGAVVDGEPVVMPDGRIGHAELAIGDGVLYLADEHPEIGVAAPRPNAAAVSLVLPVGDADAVRAAAIDAGATGDRPPYDGYGERMAWIVDPFGHRWGLHSPLPAAEPAYRTGDVGYVSLWVPDRDRAARFYRAVLGWDVPAGPRRHVSGQLPAIGLWSTAEGPTLFCCYAVADARASAEAVRAAGGRAGEPIPEPFGTVVECVDDQGTAFAMYQPPASHVGARPPANGRRHGDLGYLTLEVVDSAKARAFYGSVLGWRFAPGSVPDGWQVEGPVPMTGLSGGHERATAVPLWRVDDVAAVVAAVRAHGGTASDPERQPYGLTADCADDQGLRFHLGQL
ncbi:VOC family protein [Actinocatenispora sera]|uniref:VOC family protein n=1 Tax=Actinocatenispora sera TaxID=390989 RepID=UPI0033DFAEFD